MRSNKALAPARPLSVRLSPRRAAQQLLSFTNIRPLVALGRLDEVGGAIDEAFRLRPDLRSSAAQTGALTMYELRWHGHADAADALGVRLVARLGARPAAEASTVQGRHDQAVVLMATHRWSELQALADSMAPGDPGNVEVLRLRGVASAMQGRGTGSAARVTSDGSPHVLESTMNDARGGVREPGSQFAARLAQGGGHLSPHYPSGAILTG